MDINLLRTFLEVNRTRHFGKAAENINLTQSAVSARIRLLEEDLGVQLFTRARNNIELTPAGERLVRHAESIINAWQRAQQDVALTNEEMVPLAVGGVPSLWDSLLQDWLHRVYRSKPQLAIQAEAHSQEILVRKLLAGGLDIGFMFEPPQYRELAVSSIPSVRLMMVASRPGIDAQEAVGENYVMVDWGTSFAISHARNFPDMPPPVIRMGLGRMALAFVLECGGACYLTEGMVKPHLQAGRLHGVAAAPVIERKAYAVYPFNSDRHPAVTEVLELLDGG